MYYDKEQFIQFYNKWSAMIKDYRLPMWKDFPDIELYMDQVIVLLNQYLEIFAQKDEHKETNEQEENKYITPAMINNYVKMKIIPAPKKKRYSKQHLAYLVMLCSLKNILNISVIQKILPLGLNDDEIEYIYDSFVKNQQKAFLYVIDSVDAVAQPILSNPQERSERINDLVIQTAISANLTKILTEKMIELHTETDEDK